MIRILTLCAGLAGGAGLSQYPEFAQQYTQRLAGQVDALSVVVADFDRSALAAGMTRSEALAQLTGTTFLDNRRADMTRTFARQAVLSENLSALQAASPFERMRMPQRMADPETLRNTWSDFRPAVPLTLAGFAAGGAGFLGAAAIFGGFLSLLRTSRPSKPRRAPMPVQTTRADPPLRRPATAPEIAQRPRLMGERRP